MPRGTVHCGRLSARLSPTQYALLQYVYTHSKVGSEEAQDAAWGGKEISDGAIRAACSKINARLMERGFKIELSAHHGRISLEEIA